MVAQVRLTIVVTALCAAALAGCRSEDERTLARVTREFTHQIDEALNAKAYGRAMGLAIGSGMLQREIDAVRTGRINLDPPVPRFEAGHRFDKENPQQLVDAINDARFNATLPMGAISSNGYDELLRSVLTEEMRKDLDRLRANHTYWNRLRSLMDSL